MSCSNRARCEQAIDEGMQRTIFSSDPANFPVKTAPHCRMCNFLSVCEAGKKWVAENWAEDSVVICVIHDHDQIFRWRGV